MTQIRFETREIGSLAKPSWRVKAVAGRPLTEDDIQAAKVWGEKLGVEGYEELLEVLAKDALGEGDLERVHDFAALYALRLLEGTGLDVVYDGEQRRSEMYDHVVRHARGFEARGTVRSWDNKYYKKAAVVEQPSVHGIYDLDEFDFVRAHARRAVKVPFTGAYTIMDWSYDEHYGREGGLGAPAERRARARAEFASDVATRVVRPEVDGIVAAGASWVQIDEPAATTRPDEVPLVVETFNQTRRGIAARVSMHICFSDYTSLFPHIEGLEDCYELLLEFANRDSTDPGVTAEARPGYSILEDFIRSNWRGRIGLGVVDIHSDFVERPELVRDRILHAAEILGPERINVNPDCGLRTRTWEVAYAKLRNMVAGARAAEASLNG